MRNAFESQPTRQLVPEFGSKESINQNVNEEWRYVVDEGQRGGHCLEQVKFAHSIRVCRGRELVDVVDDERDGPWCEEDEKEKVHDYH